MQVSDSPQTFTKRVRRGTMRHGWNRNFNHVLIVAAILLYTLLQSADAASYYVDSKIDALRTLFRSRPQLGMPLCVYEDNEEDEESEESYGNESLTVLEMPYSEYLKRSANKSNFNVYVGLQLLQVEVDEKNQRITVGLSIMKWWRDCRLMWTPDVSPMEDLSLSFTEFNRLNFYSPGLKILEDVDPYIPDRFISQVIITKVGWVSVLSQTKTTLPCRMSVADYPFDTQQCNLTFESLADLSQINMTALYGEGGDLKGNIIDPAKASSFLLGHTRYVGSDTWLSVLLPAKYGLRNKCGSDDDLYCFSPQLSYRLLLRRRPSYQVTSLMVPAFLVVFISSVVFLMPFDKSDKMGLTLSILLSMLMFTQLMYDMMPDTGSTQPLLSQYFLACIGMVSSSCVFAAISSLIGSLRSKVPRWLQNLVLFSTTFLLCDWKVESQEQKRKAEQKRIKRALLLSLGQTPYADEATNETNNRVEQERAHSDSGADRVVHDREELRWNAVSALAERCFFVLHMLVDFALFIGMFWNGYTQWYEFGEKNLTENDWSFICVQGSAQNDDAVIKMCEYRRNAAASV